MALIALALQSPQRTREGGYYFGPGGLMGEVGSGLAG